MLSWVEHDKFYNLMARTIEIEDLIFTSDFNGSNIFAAMGFCSRPGYFEPLWVKQSAMSGGKWGQFRDVFSIRF